jgi:MT0933-like antitoxin protein
VRDVGEDEGATMDMEGFLDKADDAITQGEEELDERTGGRFDEQTDRAAEEVRERGGGLGDQPAEGAQQEDEPQP